MLATLGYGSLDDLVAAAVPDAIKVNERLELDARERKPTCSPRCAPSPSATGR